MSYHKINVLIRIESVTSAEFVLMCPVDCSLNELCSAEFREVTRWLHISGERHACPFCSLSSFIVIRQRAAESLSTRLPFMRPLNEVQWHHQIYQARTCVPLSCTVKFRVKGTAMCS